MPTPIYRVVYVSAASELFSKSALLELLSKAREKNNRLGVTGLLLLHIPVENEHLFRFKMNADSGLRVHRFRTPQCTYSDVR